MAQDFAIQRWQFRLRSLFVLMVVIGLGCAVYSGKFGGITQMIAIVVSIVAVTGFVLGVVTGLFTESAIRVVEKLRRWGKP